MKYTAHYTNKSMNATFASMVQKLKIVVEKKHFYINDDNLVNKLHTFKGSCALQMTQNNYMLYSESWALVAIIFLYWN